MHMRGLCVACLLITGCGRTGPELAEVAGLVTLDGQPLPEAYVEFIPVEGGRASGGVTDDAGRYELVYSVRETGALVGKSRVLITTGDPANPRKRPEKVPPRYNQQTTLMATVESGSNQHDFKLTSK